MSLSGLTEIEQARTSQASPGKPIVFIVLEWCSLVYLYRISMQEIQIVRVRKEVYE